MAGLISRRQFGLRAVVAAIVAPMLGETWWLHTPAANHWAYERGYRAVIDAQTPTWSGRWASRHRMCHAYDRWHPKDGQRTCRRMAAEDNIPSRAYAHYRRGWLQGLAETVPAEHDSPRRPWPGDAQLRDKAAWLASLQPHQRIGIQPQTPPQMPVMPKHPGSHQR